MTDNANISVLIQDLSSPDRLVRSSAVWTLLDKGEAAKDALPALKRLVEDHHEPVIKVAAAGCITRIALAEVVMVFPVLLDALYDRDCAIRCMAAEFLGDLGPRAESAVPLLRVLVTDVAESVRCSASEAIGKITGDWSAAFEVGVKLLDNEDWLARRVGEEHLRTVKLGQSGMSSNRRTCN